MKLYITSVTVHACMGSGTPNHACSQCTICAGVPEDVYEMTWDASATQCNDRDLDSSLDILNKLQIETTAAAVFIDAIQKDLPRPRCLDRRYELTNIEVLTFSSSFGCALIPAVLLAHRPDMSRLHCVMGGFFR